MKPLESVQNLKIARELVMRGEAWPPTLRIWFCDALDQWLKCPSHTLDQRLGLRSRSGGRLHATSKLPQLHAAIRRVAGDVGIPAERARSLAARVARHHCKSDAELALIERQFGRIPRSGRQLARILAGGTEASRQEV